MGRTPCGEAIEGRDGGGEERKVGPKEETEPSPRGEEKLAEIQKFVICH